MPFRTLLVPVLACVTLAASCRESTGPADPTLRERWRVAQPGYGYARPAVVGDVVYFGTGDGQVIARNVATGTARWATKIGVELVGGWNLVARGGVIVASITGSTSGVDGATGRELWRYVSPLDTVGYRGGVAMPGFLVNNSLDADDQTVYIPAWGASVSAVDLKTGVARWVWWPGKSAGDTAVVGIFRSGAEGARVSGDTVFVTAWHFLDYRGLHAEGWLVALDRTSGREMWRVVMPQYTGGVVLRGAPALFGNLVIFTSAGGHAYAVDRATRTIVWHHVPVPQHTTDAQAEVVGDVVYIDGGDDRVYALGAADGAERWHADVGLELTTDILATDRRLIFASGRYLVILDRATGQELLRMTQPGTSPDNSLFSSGAAAKGDQIFVSMNGAAWSFDQP
jgi:outer membrane protein assembly factor BamB